MLVVYHEFVTFYLCPTEDRSTGCKHTCSDSQH